MDQRSRGEYNERSERNSNSDNGGGPSRTRIILETICEDESEVDVRGWYVRTRVVKECTEIEGRGRGNPYLSCLVEVVNDDLGKRFMHRYDWRQALALVDAIASFREKVDGVANELDQIRAEARLAWGNERRRSSDNRRDNDRVQYVDEGKVRDNPRRRRSRESDRD